MAKMFYTLEEVAAKLGVSEDDVKRMAEQGKLQQFRDRDKLMFKRDQVDKLSSDEATTMKVDRPKPGLEDTGSIPLAGGKSSQTDAIDLVAETAADRPRTAEAAKSATATGISVFDADEIDAADPLAQTQVTAGGMDDELTLDTVGSGSGLLDLTRESDDTSLGAVELLEDVPGGGEGSDMKMTADVPGGSTGLFEVAGGAESAMAATGAAPYDTQAAYLAAEPDDPAGDWFGGMSLLGVLGVLAIAMIVSITALNGLLVDLTLFFVRGSDTPPGSYDPNRLAMFSIILFVVCLVLGVIGFFVGRSRANRFD